MKILIGVDESTHADAAVDYIVKTKWPKDTQVVVLSAVNAAAAVYSQAYVPAPTYAQEMWQDLVRSHEEIASKAERALRAAGLRTEAKVLQGDPRDLLVDLARTERADLVVVGSHGRSGMTKLLMGSVATHVVTHAPCNVLVIKLPK
jgi:nucleotide-binding universal stress UspA family protein